MLVSLQRVNFLSQELKVHHEVAIYYFFCLMEESLIPCIGIEELSQNHVLV